MFQFIKRFIRGISKPGHDSMEDRVIKKINDRVAFRMKYPIVLDAIILESRVTDMGFNTAISDSALIGSISKFVESYMKESIELQDDIRKWNPNLFEVIDVIF